ncbi:MAG: hypothetical protein DRN05_07485 [Thermoplasmata archaeon]|nr:MAG: hypothetical protein DRN05_07485 [Thermoplasmata archaeon]
MNPYDSACEALDEPFKKGPDQKKLFTVFRQLQWGNLATAVRIYQSLISRISFENPRGAINNFQDRSDHS